MPNREDFLVILVCFFSLASVAKPNVDSDDIHVFHCEGTYAHGLALDEAVQCVRDQGNVDRVLQARTLIEEGRAIHRIEVMTTLHEVRTYRVAGRVRGRLGTHLCDS